VNRYDHRRALLDLAHRLGRGDELSTNERDFLCLALYRVGTGEDANHVFNVQGGRGLKLADVIARRRMSVILHWVACAVNADSEPGETVMSIEAACVEAVDSIVPLAKEAFPGADHCVYDVDYIRQCWTDPKFAHLRSPMRGWYDPDFPYAALPVVKGSK
jgi:hypothetical protein